jgi:hypothetical protein
MIAAERHVADLIREAFLGVTLGNGVGLRQGRGLDGYANQETLARLRLQDEQDNWPRIPPEDLNHFSDAVSFFDAEGMRFHLPAYLIADLKGTLTSDIIFHLTYIEEEYGRSQFSQLNAEQRHAVREYLLLRLAQFQTERSSDDPATKMIEVALSSYWIPPERT